MATRASIAFPTARLFSLDELARTYAGGGATLPEFMASLLFQHVNASLLYQRAFDTVAESFDDENKRKYEERRAAGRYLYESAGIFQGPFTPSGGVLVATSDTWITFDNFSPSDGEVAYLYDQIDGPKDISDFRHGLSPLDAACGVLPRLFTILHAGKCQIMTIRALINGNPIVFNISTPAKLSSAPAESADGLVKTTEERGDLRKAVRWNIAPLREVTRISGAYQLLPFSMLQAPGENTCAFACALACIFPILPNAYAGLILKCRTGEAMRFIARDTMLNKHKFPVGTFHDPIDILHEWRGIRSLAVQAPADINMTVYDDIVVVLQPPSGQFVVDSLHGTNRIVLACIWQRPGHFIAIVDTGDGDRVLYDDLNEHLIVTRAHVTERPPPYANSVWHLYAVLAVDAMLLKS